VTGVEEAHRVWGGKNPPPRGEKKKDTSVMPSREKRGPSTCGGQKGNPTGAGGNCASGPLTGDRPPVHSSRREGESRVGGGAGLGAGRVGGRGVGLLEKNGKQGI